MSDSINISVIVPVLDASNDIEQCISHLLNQSMPNDRYEIIIVDNGSTDNTPKLVEQYPVRLEFENTIKSPYAARNKGLEVAKGKVIAFTDADCYADYDWLANGEKIIIEQEVDMVGGKVNFRFSNPPELAEIYDSISNLEMKNNIKRKGVAKTGNLFVKKEVFGKVGFFKASVRSGGDVEWTGRASSEGFTIVFGEDVIVNKKARKLKSLLKKQVRVGKGQINAWLSKKKPWKVIAKDLLKGMRPVSKVGIQQMIDQRGDRSFKDHINGLYGVGFLCRISTSLGRIKSLFNFFVWGEK